MPRLIDHIRATGRLQMPAFVTTKEAAWAEYAKTMMDLLMDPDLPVLLIDNVAEYYYSGTDQEYWDLGKDFPNLAPPYPQFWVEYKLPHEIVSKEKGNTDLSQWVTRGRAGLLITAIDPKDVQGEGVPPEARWILWCDLWIDYGFADGSIQGPHGAMFVCLDGEGRILERPWMQAFAGDELAPLMKSIMSWLHPAFLAVSFLHCKNVVIEDHAVDRPLAKKFRARHGFNPTPYKTLVIEPLKQILRNQGRAHEHGLAKAMHICRGHFADYREGRGLFGKYKKLVWMPATVRGTKGKKAPAREIEVKV